LKNLARVIYCEKAPVIFERSKKTRPACEGFSNGKKASHAKRVLRYAPE